MATTNPDDSQQQRQNGTANLSRTRPPSYTSVGVDRPSSQRETFESHARTPDEGVCHLQFQEPEVFSDSEIAEVFEDSDRTTECTQQDQDETEMNNNAPEEKQRLELAAVHTAIHRSLRDIRREELQEVPHDDVEITILTADGPCEITDVLVPSTETSRASNLSEEVVGSPLSSQLSARSLNPHPATLTQTSPTYVQRTTRKHIERSFVPAVRMERCSSTSLLYADGDEEKEEVRDQLTLSKAGTQGDTLTSQGRNNLSASSHPSHGLESGEGQGLALGEREMMHSNHTTKADDDGDLEQENDPVPELPSIMEGDNQTRPGAFTAPGRAFGSFPVWGRAGALANSQLPSSSSTASRSSARRPSDLFRNNRMLSFRVAAHWLSNQQQHHHYLSSQGGTATIAMVEAQAVEAETVVYASDVRADRSKRIIRSYAFAVCVAAAIIILLTISLSLVLTRHGPPEKEEGPNQGNNAKGNNTKDKQCETPDSEKDVFMLCLCYNTTEKLDLSHDEWDLYSYIYSNLTQPELLPVRFDNRSCIPENKSILWMANYRRSGLNISDFRSWELNDLKQIFALVYLFSTLNGTGWKQKNGWLEDVFICRWYGVSCGIVTRIMSIRLNSNGLTGTIPEEIKLLPFLQVLDMSGNTGMHGTVPTAIGQMPSLYQVDLNGCNLTGTLPTQIQNLTRIEELYLEGNKFSGTLPSGLSDLSSLRTLSVRGNLFHGTIPQTLCNLRDLGYLDLSHNVFSGTLPPCLGNLTYLNSIFLQDNEINGTLPTTFCPDDDEAYLEKLVLANCTGPYHLDNCHCCSNKTLRCVEDIPYGFQGTV